MNTKLLRRRTIGVATSLALAAALVGAPATAFANPSRAAERVQPAAGAASGPARIAGPSGPAAGSSVAGPSGPAAGSSVAGPPGPAAGSSLGTRGALLSVTTVARLSAAEVAAVVSQISWDTGHVRYGVTAYRIEYRTIDPAGRPTTASALVVLPDVCAPGTTTRGGTPLPVIFYGHGTQTYRGGVASMAAGNGDREAAELFSSAGYATVAPDYLGLGTGAGYHPYMDTASEVSAGLDALRAAAALAGQQGRTLDPRLLVTGFSQGGTVTMGLGDALQRGADPFWRLRALAPISGPYDLQHTELAALIDHPGDGDGELDPVDGTLYIAYWTVAMNRLYPLYRSPSEVFRAPYDASVEQLFDGAHDEETILANLPGTPADLLTPEYLRRLRQPGGALLAAERAGDGTCQWGPRVPVRLFAADGDRDALIANAWRCQQELRAHGVTARLTDVGPVDHTGSAILSIPQVLGWFTGLG